ncbi:hypothetical protein pb186bvf_000918 [Paramecium bursaria]
MMISFNNQIGYQKKLRLDVWQKKQIINRQCIILKLLFNPFRFRSQCKQSKFINNPSTLLILQMINKPQKIFIQQMNQQQNQKNCPKQKIKWIFIKLNEIHPFCINSIVLIPFYSKPLYIWHNYSLPWSQDEDLLLFKIVRHFLKQYPQQILGQISEVTLNHLSLNQIEGLGHNQKQHNLLIKLSQQVENQLKFQGNSIVTISKTRIKIMLQLKNQQEEFNNPIIKHMWKGHFF